jgi:hypothetical protein
MQSEQVVRRPAERLGLPTPLGKEELRVLDRLLPAVNLDVVGAAALKLLGGFSVGERGDDPRDWGSALFGVLRVRNKRI